jgi:hypothetical protein
MRKICAASHPSVFLLYLLLSVTTAFAQIGQSSTPKSYDSGDDPTVAILPSGLIFEVHSTGNLLSRSIWYHIGQLNGTKVNWGPSRLIDSPALIANWPSVAVTPEGYVVVTYSAGASKSDSNLRYWAGQIRPDGDISQSVNWFVQDVRYDSGFHNSIVYANGVLVDVHESGSGGRGLYYRIGFLTNPGAGDFKITWLTLRDGIKYDDGINPQVAINKDNQVVEVHQVTGESLLHYRRGRLVISVVPGLTNIAFSDAPRFENNGRTPAIVFINPETVLELDKTRFGLQYRTGTLSSNPQRVDWGNPLTFPTLQGESPDQSAVTSGAKVAVAVYGTLDHKLSYSVAGLP